MKQEKEKELWGNCDIEKDMSWNMYQILVNTAVSANLIGTICNFYIHGTELPTIALPEPVHRRRKLSRQI